MLSVVYPAAGAVVWTPVRVGAATVRHVGLVSDRWHGGAPMVLHRSKRRRVAVEEPWSVFANGPVYLERPACPGVSASSVLARARTMIGSEWRMLTQNCEHYCATARGEPVRSDQVRERVAAAMLGLGLGLGVLSALRDRAPRAT